MGKKYYTVGTVPKSNTEIVQRGKIDTPNTQIHRRGKGNIYVFAAGNNFPLDNANANGILANPFTIAISSVGKNNQTSIYGQVGSSIMAVAYGGDDLLFSA
jgi:hypothetical protein